MPFHLLLLAGSLALAQPGKPSFVVECRIVDLQKVANSEGKKNDSTGSVAATTLRHIVWLTPCRGSRSLMASLRLFPTNLNDRS